MSKVININAGHNREILDRCPTLKGYAELIALIRKHQKEGEEIKTAVSAAIGECIRRGILRDYLMKQKSEAENMILTEFDQDAYEEMLRDEGRAEGHTQGKAEGKAEGKTEGMILSLQAVRLLSEGKSVPETAKETGMPEKDIEALAKYL